MQVLYGDTDSMFVRLPGRSKDAQCHAKAFDGWGMARWGREEFHGLVTWIGLSAQFHTFSSFPLFFIRWKEQAFEEGAEIAKQAAPTIF